MDLVPTPGGSQAPAATLRPMRDLGRPERAVSLAGGAAVIIAGAIRGGPVGWVGAAIGSALLARGLGGRDVITDRFRATPAEAKDATTRGWSQSAMSGAAVTINAAPDRLMAFWRDPAKLAAVMENVEAATTAGGTTDWTFRGPTGSLTAKTTMAEDTAKNSIEWTSTPDSALKFAAKIAFEPSVGDRGTVARLTLAYDPPYGTLGRAAARLTQREPSVQARRDLKRFKMLIETGEISTNGSKSGSKSDASGKHEPVPVTA